jgi:hypothetical protein
MFIKKTMSILLVVFGMATLVHAQSKGTIVYVILQDSVKIDPVTDEYPDMPYIYALQDSGYNVIPFYNAALSAASQKTLDTLLNADLIIMGRSTPSLIYGDHKLAWNDLPTPILNIELWNCRSSRLNWFNTTNMVSLGVADTVYNAVIETPEDPVFQGLDTSAPVPWAIGPIDVIGTTDAGNGTVLAKMQDINYVLFVRFEPFVDFYDGAGEYPGGYRTVIGNGRDVSGAAPFHYYAFTPESEKVFFAEIANLIALGGGTAVPRREGTTAPSACTLGPNYPNPFNPSTTIQYVLPKRSKVTLTVFNLLGKEVTNLVEGEKEAGFHEVQFDGSNLESGVYFCRVQAGGFTQTRKLMILR